jgi:hypothetical protein
MRKLPNLPNTSVATLTHWTNFHHTIVDRAVPTYLTPGTEHNRAPVLSEALSAVLKYCAADPPTPLCTVGSRWSLSNILDPKDVILDPGVWNQIAAVEKAWLTEGYQKRAAVRGGTPVIVQGGTQIRTLNQTLGSAGLALQTSGASDGHRMAGCIATGTHGSHLRVGAVHDTVLGVCLVVAPGRAVFVQPSERNFDPELARWFQDSTTLQTQDVADDQLFQAAQVALGGLGFVHSVVIEAVPLYQWRGVNVGRALHDPAIWHALETHDTRGLHPLIDPDFFSLVLSPFAGNSSHGATATLMWKCPPIERYRPATPVQPTTSTDLSRLLTRLIPLVDGGLAGAALSAVIAAQTSEQYGPGPIAPVFPGVYFGPTRLPEGNGRSTEVVVDHRQARAAVETVLATLQREAAAGRHLLGGVGVRFAPATRAHLGMNIHAMNAYIELPSISTPATSVIHRAVWRSLQEAQISFVCHWGQEYGMDQGSVHEYYGERVAHWKQARAQLLDSPALRSVFTNPLLQRLGLA